MSSLQVGGMEQFVLRIATAQCAAGYDAEILALRGGPLADRAHRAGVRVRVLAGGHRALRLASALAHLASCRPEVVHGHNVTSLHYATLGKLLGARVVLTHHGQGAGAPRTPSRREWRRTDAVVAVSRAAREGLDVPGPPQRILVIHNGVAPRPSRRSRAEVRAALGIGRETVGIIVARVDGLKGHETLIHALPKLPPALPLTVIAAGDGAERARLEALARTQSIGPERLRFLGHREDIPDLLAASDFFLLPSMTEGLPLSVLEAMSHRLPVIATAVGGIPEIITAPEQGILVAPRDPDALAAAVRRMSTDAALRACIGEAGWQRVRDHFSFEAMCRAYEDLYRSLLPVTAGPVQAPA